MLAFSTLRQRLPPEQPPHQHKFSIAGHEFYLKVQEYSRGDIGALTLQAARENAAVNGLLDGLSRTTSLSLQHGIPLENLIEEWKGSRFEPSGFTSNHFIFRAKSPADYVATYLGHYQAVFPYPPPGLVRRTLLESTHPITHKFSVGGHEGFLSFWSYPRESAEPAPVSKTSVGKIRLCWAKEGSHIYGLMDTICTTASTALQHGLPLQALLKEWKGLSFPPNGRTQDASETTSVLDYAAHFLAKHLELE